SDQVQGYVEQSRFHSSIQSANAKVHGCVVFTNDQFFHTYSLAPNEALTRVFPCFATHPPHDLAGYFRSRLTKPNHFFASEFATGCYKQTRSFVHLIGQQILDPPSSPFVLQGNQRVAFATVKGAVAKILTTKRPKKTLFLIEGPPGCGKSAVAAKLWASLVTDNKTA